MRHDDDVRYMYYGMLRHATLYNVRTANGYIIYIHKEMILDCGWKGENGGMVLV